MNDRSSANDYVLVPARSIDERRLIDFAASVWPEQRPDYRVISSWWRRAEPSCAVAAVHQPTGAMAGLCGGRPCEWSLADRSLDAIAICDWYVAPGHAGRGLGKRLVQHFEAPDRFLYAFSISDAAIANFKRLGWTGPHRSPLMLLPLPRFAGIALSVLTDGSGLELEERDLAGGEPLGEVGPALDHIEAIRSRDAQAHMRRGARDWSWRLSICDERHYRFCIARRAGEPVGYVVVRRLTPGRSRQLGKVATAIITDLVAPRDDPIVLRALAHRAVAIAGQLRTAIVLVTTSAPAHRTALTKTGFISPAFPMIGRFLGRRSPQFMWVPRGPAAPLRAVDMALTFADVAIDLDL
jgi:GNAT superfamily N-acetyltransferase